MQFPNKRFIALMLAVLATGCSHADRPAMLDPSATLTLQGESMVREVTDNGQVSIFDVNQQKTVFSGRVKKNDLVTVDPVAKRILIGDEVAADNLRGGDDFRITFSPGM